MSDKEGSWFSNLIGLLLGFGALIGVYKKGEHQGVKDAAESINKQTAENIKELEKAKEEAKKETINRKDIDKWL